MHDLVGDLGFRQLEDHHRSTEHHREETQGESFPGLQSNQGKSERHQSGSFELQTQQEWYHNLLNESTAYKYDPDKCIRSVVFYFFLFIK